jgi:DNA-binding CsgD family transcriptional regulator
MPHLSPLMHKILELVYGEHTDSEIAKELGLEKKTVSNYLSELIYPELQVKGRVGAALWFSQNYGDKAYKYPDTYPVELRRLGLDKKCQETKDISQPPDLSDHIGQWCAWCVRYFNPRDDIGAYRPYRPGGRVSLSKDMLGAELELERVFDWTVPVHHGGCPLAGVEPNTTVAAVPFDLFFRCQPNELEILSNTAYMRGNLTTSVALYLMLYHHYFNEGNEESVATQFAKATIDNAGSINNEVVGQILRSHVPKNIHKMTYQWIEILLGLGNRVRNNGNPDMAERRLYSQARRKTDKMLERNPKVKAVRILDTLERREMTVAHCVESKNVERVIDNARDHNDRRGLLTACQVVGWHYFRDGDYVTAEKNFSLIDSEGKKPNTTDSWWHKMAGWLGLGATLYVNGSKNYEQALYHCLRSEYISAILGLQIDVTRGISEQFLGLGTLLSPPAVVRKIVKESGFAKEKMEEIRHTALIESGLQKELLAELSGASWAYK